MNGTTISSRTGLQPLVRMPTRGSNTLDQIFVGNVCSYKIKTVKSIVKSDHLAIIAHTDQMLNLNKMNKSVIFRKKSPAQNFAFLNEINTTSDFDDILKIGDVQDACNLLYVKLNHYLDKYYPKRTVTLTNKDPDFISPEIKLLLRLKNRKMRSGKVDEAGAIAEKIQKLIIKNNANSLRHLKCSNTKKLWQHVNKITKKTDDGMEILPNITAVSLNKYYSTISTDPQYIEPFNKSSTVRNQNYISVLTTYKILERLKPTAAGPDGIPAWFLRLLAPELAIPLAHIYNLSIIQSVVPSQWKVARIVPIPKIKNPAELSDFRPLSITSIISRQLEKFVVQEYLYPALLNPPDDLIFSDQYAFRPLGQLLLLLLIS